MNLVKATAALALAASLTACGDTHPSVNLGEVPTATQTVPSSTSAPTTAPAISGISLTKRHTWSFYDDQGYTFDMTVSLSEPVMFASVRGKSHPDNPALIVDKQCGDGPNYENAAVIAGVMSATATTPKFPTKISMDIYMGRTIPNPNEPIMPVPLMMVAQTFSHDDGTVTDGCDNNSGPNGLHAGVNWTNPIQPGSTVKQPFLLIIQNWSVGLGRTLTVIAASKSQNGIDFLYHTNDNFAAPLVA